MKKIALIITAAVMLNFGTMIFKNFANTSYAETKSINDYNYSFNVQDKLTLDSDSQPASYFDDDDNSPIVSFITRIIEFATKIIGSIGVILLIISGFMFMVSQGNQQKLDEAKDIFKFTVIGLVVVFLSYLITIFVQSIFASNG